MKTIPRLLFLACCNNSAQVSHLPEKEETFGGRPVFEFWFLNYELNGFGKPFLVLSYMSKKTSQTGWLKQTFFTVPEAGNSKIKVLAYLMSGYGPLNLSESSFLLCKMEIVIPHSYLIILYILPALLFFTALITTSNWVICLFYICVHYDVKIII